MIPLPLPPKVTDKGSNKAIFELAGLYPGYGVTIGNTLRRVLLSSIEGAAVTEVKIKGVPHEFSTIPGVLEDVIMILLNLKNLRFKIHGKDSQKAQLKIKGEKKVKGSDFKLSPQMKLANPELHIATITDKKTELEIEITVENGVGYVPRENRTHKKSEIGTIAMDAVFTPVKNVSFYTENMRVGERTDFDRLFLEIQTDGAVTPEEVFYNACEILIQHFNIILNGKIDSAPAKKTAGRKIKEASQEDLSKMPVKDLNLSARTQNAVLDNGIKTVAGIVKRTEKSLSELEGMGEKGMQELKKKLKKLGLEIKPE